MTRIHEIAEYADGLLETETTPDYSSAVNGLQLENRSDITGIAAAVDFSTRAINGAIAGNANLLIVHHGMFWDGPGSITGPSYRRLRLLIENDIAVYSSHLPLDRHPILGNNVLLAKALGLNPSGDFAEFEGIFTGVRGETEIETASLVERARKFTKNHESEVRTTPIEKEPQNETVGDLHRRRRVCRYSQGSTRTGNRHPHRWRGSSLDRDLRRGERARDHLRGTLRN
jgi:putative NIF3 family GTP cyclohydrolase 1 type 2